MTVKSSGDLGLVSDIKLEFGGTATPKLTDYYAGGSYVPSGAIGYPGGVSTYIPSSGQIKLSNFYGSTKIYTAYYYMFGIYGTNGCCSDNDYFGGDIPRTFSWITRRSNSSITFTTPNVANMKVNVSSYTVQLGCGYTYTSGGPYSSDTYYYDYMRNFGVAIYRASDDVLIGTVLNTTDQNQYSGASYNTYSVPAGTINLAPNTTYKAYYICDFYRASDIGYGDYSFGWYNNGTPIFTVTNQ